VLLLAGSVLLSACSLISSLQADPTGPGGGQFIIQCETPIRSAPDDPIVYPRLPGASHNHEFYGAMGIDAFSTAADLRNGPTGCSRDDSGGDRGDTAGYWHPTLYIGGRRAPVTKSTFYYNDGGKEAAVQAFPPGLKVIAGDMMATAPQGDKIVYWGCGNGSSISKVESPPQCGDGELSLHVIFPDCWNGRDLDSVDHKSHMAYSQRGDDDKKHCPSSHPVPLPELTMRYIWGDQQPDPSSLTLSSGSVHSMHADFWNTWNQARLEQLVSHCVNAGKKCDYDDVDALPFPGGPPGTDPPTTDPTTTEPTTTEPTTTEPTTTEPTTTAPPGSTIPDPPDPRGDELLANPDFERGIAGWEAEDGTLAGRTPLAHSGDFAAVLIRADLAGTGHARFTTSVPASGTCLANGWVAGPAGGAAVIRLRGYTSASSDDASARQEITLVRGWNRVSVAMSGVEGSLRLDTYLSDAAPGQGILLDDLSLKCA
jgi:hypothetical protein